MNPESRHMLPQIAFNTFFSKYQEPKLDEGFNEILQIDFKFEGSMEEQEIWRKFWT
jgi:bifunctional polynucleotide phosphatase/kinase